MSLDSASDELRETFKRALRRFPAAVSVITSADQDRRHGMTATAVTSLSLDPPSLIVCINQATLLHDIMLLARRFCVNVLRRDQVPLSSAFSGALPAEERFGLGIASRYLWITPVLSGAVRKESQDRPPARTASEQSALAGVLASGPNTLEA